MVINFRFGVEAQFVRSAMSSSGACLFAFFVGVSSSLAFAKLPVLPSSQFLLAVIAFLVLCFTVLRPLAFFCLGLLWMCFNVDLHIDNSFPDEFERKDISVVGTVSSLPISRSGNKRFRFHVVKFEKPELAHLSGQKIQLSCYRCKFNLRAGEQWRLTVRLKRPHGYASWGAFDYEKYLFRHQLIAKGYVRAKSENIRISSSDISLNRWRESIKDQILAMPSSEIGEDQGVGRSILLALTIGVKTGFTHTQQQVLQATGVSHLMAISGLHVGLVFIAVSRLFSILLWPFVSFYRRHPRQQLCLVPALAAAVCYAAMAGFSVSTQRAIVMLVVYVVCNFLAREASLSKVLLIAIFVILLLDPFSVLDVGFWLSCGAVAVIALMSEGASKLSLLKLQPMLWIGMWPMSILLFAQVSLVSPLVNLVMVPLFCTVLIPLTLLAFLLLILGAEQFSTWCFGKLSWVYDFVYKLLEGISQYGFAKIYATPLLWWQWCLIAMLIVLCIPRIKQMVKGFTTPFILVTSSVIGVLFVSLLGKPVEHLKSDELRVALLDVGQGLAMVFETQNSVTVYDTGPRYGSGFSTAEAVLLPYLRRRGISKIDTLVISHADNDHIGGLNAVRGAFEVGRVLTSRLDKVSDAIECTRGQRWSYDQTHYSVLSPDSATPKGSNNRSCVIMIEHLGQRVLISGDIEKQVEHYLVRTATDRLAADFLLVPHQGSKTSSTSVFLDAVSPNTAMLAAGYKNHYGHPHPKVVARYHERGIKLLSTIDSGSILLVINSKGTGVSRFREQQRHFWSYQKVPNRR